jgi:hypothetical protein
MALEVHKEQRASDIGEIMSIDGQVLVIAFLAISLKLLLWAREAAGVEVEDELHRSPALHHDGHRHAGEE